jgi:hypothetical protein
MAPAKKNEPITLDALPPGTVVELQGKQYPTHAGLLALGHAHGLTSMLTDVLSYADGEAVVKCTIEGSRGTYTGHGDASPANVSRNIASAVLRMAETRAQNRALRAYLGLGATTHEELPPEAVQGRAPSRGGGNPRPAPKRAQSAPSGAQTHSPDCPVCQGPMWDNCEKRAGGWKGPAWKCKDRDCDGVYWEASDAPSANQGGSDEIPF